MRTPLFIILVALLFSQLRAQDSKPIDTRSADFYYYLVGNWRNGPEVFITSPIAGDQSLNTDILKRNGKNEFKELKGISEIDMVIEPDLESAWNSIRILKSKYRQRQLQVRVLEPSKTEEE